MMRRILVIGAVLALSLANIVPASAERAAGAPQQGGVAYVSGGVGSDERARMEAMGSDFNLRVEVAIPAGNYVGSPRIEIRDAAGKTVLDAQSDGPLLYAKVPPGSYNVAVHEAGKKSAQKSVQVGTGPTKVTLHLAGGEPPDPPSAEH